MIRAILTALLIVVWSPAWSQSLEGVYTNRTDDGVATLKLSKIRPDSYSGSISMGDDSATFTGKVAGGKVKGILTAPNSDARASFVVSRAGNQVEFEYTLLGPDNQPIQGATRKMVFSAPARHTTPPKKVNSPRQASAGTVRINGVVIPSAKLDNMARKYGQRIPGGDYWYDNRCGAWGKAGGPTLGFTAAGLNLGGKLQSGASNGNTGVFVNGRQLHVADVQSIQSYGVPVARGRWWVDSKFNFGSEGSSAALGNLLQIAQQVSGKRYGGSSSPNTGVQSASDGEGGFMATVKDGHGGYIGWYSGQ
jgi:hypothetical protein